MTKAESNALALALFLSKKPPPDMGVGKGRALPPGVYVDPHWPLSLMDDGVFRPKTQLLPGPRPRWTKA